MTIPEFSNKKDLFKFLVENKQSLIAQKKSVIKHTDSILSGYSVDVSTKDGQAKKDGFEMVEVVDEYKVSVVMNTTNYLDSHGDVHISGLWQKTLNENKFLMHVQEHKSDEFEKIIADGNELVAFTKEMQWIELGQNYVGSTQALIFDSILKKAGKEARNEFMAEQYINGYVKQHSVGMIYVKLYLAINDNEPYYAAEFDAWNKYYPLIANKDKADLIGYFWAVTEAKLVEGSAVTLGSNPVTPTLSNNFKQINETTENTIQPVQITEIKSEPSKDTLFCELLRSLKNEF